MPYNKLFLLDYCLEDWKLVFFLLKETDLLYQIEDEKCEITPEFELKNYILLKDDWTTCIIDFREFDNI